MIHNVAVTGSTNADLAGRLRAGEIIAEGEWLRAETQTGGKGRAGRAWISPPGNLYCSTIVNTTASDPLAPTLSLVAGLAVHDALCAILPSRSADELILKWPNDLLVGGAKIAGILCERIGNAVIVGIGVNVASAPELADRKTASSHALSGPAMGAQAVLESLVRSFAARLSRWRAEPLSETIEAWESRAHPPGTPLRVLDGDSVLKGDFAGLDTSGALRLRLADGTIRAIHAGDVMMPGTD